jgi:hypothetical protein
MVWVYDRTESLFLGILMHVSITATTLVLTPQTRGVDLLAYGLAFAAAVWVVIGERPWPITVTCHERPLRRRAA